MLLVKFVFWSKECCSFVDFEFGSLCKTTNKIGSFVKQLNGLVEKLPIFLLGVVITSLSQAVIILEELVESPSLLTAEHQ